MSTSKYAGVSGVRNMIFCVLQKIKSDCTSANRLALLDKHEEASASLVAGRRRIQRDLKEDLFSLVGKKIVVPFSHLSGAKAVRDYAEVSTTSKGYVFVIVGTYYKKELAVAGVKKDGSLHKKESWTYTPEEAKRFICE